MHSSCGVKNRHGMKMRRMNGEHERGAWSKVNERICNTTPFLDCKDPRLEKKWITAMRSFESPMVIWVFILVER